MEQVEASDSLSRLGKRLRALRVQCRSRAGI
jgi:hypothetical protein